ELVGAHHFRGAASSGEVVLLVRDPLNPYGSHTVQVKDVNQIMIGYLPGETALRLSSLMDQNEITVEGVVKRGGHAIRRSSTSRTLHFYGHPHDCSTVIPKLPLGTHIAPSLQKANVNSQSFSVTKTDRVGAVPGASRSSGAGYGNFAAAAPVLNARPSDQSVSHAVNQQPRRAGDRQQTAPKVAELQRILALKKAELEGAGLRASLVDKICTNDDILKLPVHADPPSMSQGNLTVDLLRHQKQALQWCIEKENPVLPSTEAEPPVQFWEVRKHASGKLAPEVATKTAQQAKPVLGKGALFGDAMGLGKTLTMISLVLATQNDSTPNEFSKATLIVAPVSVIQNWEKQISEHVVPGKLSYYVYYGRTRKGVSANDLQKHDIVITTYHSVSREHLKSLEVGGTKTAESLLLRVAWKASIISVILDEGHEIRNPTTKIAKAVVALTADRRWVLSGTPIVNTPKDIGSMLTFLRICRPLDHEDLFKRLLLRPLTNGDPSGAELLTALMAHICLRRTKEMQDANGTALVDLPPVETITVLVTLSEEVHRLYDQLEEISANRVQSILSSTSSTASQCNVLTMLTRLRQFVLHPGLIPANYLDELKKAEAGAVEIRAGPFTPEEKSKLQEALHRAVEECEECPLCFDVLRDDAVITTCAHSFCSDCITESIRHGGCCPMDRRKLTVADIIQRSPQMDLAPGPRTSIETAQAYVGSSAKIEELVQLLSHIPHDEKSLVFSQFTSFLDKIAAALESERIPFVRFSGAISEKERRKIVDKFSVPIGPVPRLGSQNPRVMLISLKAGSLGLNLTAANHVFLMDPWWQEAIESQATDRVNRIGQKKPVRIYRLIARDTVESKVLRIQERKRALIKGAFSGTKNKEVQRSQKEARLQ
ncbi:hypothetical protein FA13DRAFT_1602234, partial [Coprinellus micaceus]